MNFHLHIGLEKTGTTSLQNTLAENVTLLMKQGFAYYRSPFPEAKGYYPNAAELLPYALASEKRSQLKSSYVGESNEFLHKFRSKFRKTILKFSNLHRNKDLIFSLEHLSRNLTSGQEWDRLKSLIDDTQRDPVIHVYLRRQDDFCLSFYPTELIHGQTKPFEYPVVAGANSLLNYSNLLEQLVTTFGETSLKVYSYDFDISVFGGTLEHFSRQIGLSCDEVKRSEDINSRMGVKESEFLRQLNTHVFKTERAKIPSHILRKALQRGPVIAGVYEPGYSRRVDFLEQLFSSNDHVNKKYFSGRQVLPVAENDVQKNTASSVSLEINDCIQIFYKLLSDQTTNV